MHLFDYTALFEGITVAQRQQIMLTETVCHYSKGEVIFGKGDKVKEIFCLTKGRVKLYMEGMDRVQILRLVRKNECFGYLPYFTDGHHSLFAMAMTDVTLMKAPMKVVKKVMTENGRVSMNFTKELAARLETIDERVVNLTQKHVRGRLADALLIMADTYGRELNSGMMDCVMSREEIAAFANMTTATAIRTLAAFRDEGVVEFVGKGLKIVNESKLEKISNMG